MRINVRFFHQWSKRVSWVDLFVCSLGADQSGAVFVIGLFGLVAEIAVNKGAA